MFYCLTPACSALLVSVHLECAFMDNHYSTRGWTSFHVHVIILQIHKSHCYCPRDNHCGSGSLWARFPWSKFLSYSPNYLKFGPNCFITFTYKLKILLNSIYTITIWLWFSIHSQVAKCVEIGIPALLIILIFSQVIFDFPLQVVRLFTLFDSVSERPSSRGLVLTVSSFPLWCFQYLKHFHHRGHHGFELYPIIIGVVIVWVFATILTVAGAYDHASALGQRNCRTDRSGLVSAAPWCVLFCCWNIEHESDSHR